MEAIDNLAGSKSPPDAQGHSTRGDSLGHKAARSIAWIVLDRWGTRFTSLLTMIVLGRLLAPADFGLIALASMFVTFASIFVDRGFAKAIVQREHLSAEHIDAAFWAAVLIAAIAIMTIMLSAPWIAARFATPEFAPVLRWMSLSLLVNAFSGTPAALLERAFDFRSLAIRRLSSTVLGGAVGIGCAFAGLGVWSLVAQTLIGSLIGVIALWSASQWRPRRLARFASLRDLAAVGLGALGIEVLTFFGAQSDRMIIGAFLGAQALGWYFMAIRMVSIMVEIFASVFSAVSLTMFSRLQNDHVRLREWLYRFTRASSAATLPCFALAAALAPIAFPYILGPQWRESVPIFQVLTLLGAVNAVAYFDQSVLLAVGRARTALILALGQGALGVALIALAAPYGVLAVAMAVVARQYCYWPVRLAVLNRAIGLQPARYLLQWLQPLAASLAMGAVVSAILWYWPEVLPSAWLNIAAGAALGVAVYLLALCVVHPHVYSDLRGTLQQMRARRS
jgi:O-antigen/teichoic acid export membrane protein